MKGSSMILTVISVGLVVSILIFLIWGCVCRVPRIPFFEGFKDAEDASKDDKESSYFKSDSKRSALTPAEQELFEDLKSNKLKDSDINKLIQKGTLTEETIEKFLMALNVNNTVQNTIKEASFDETKESKETKKVKKANDKDEIKIEGFVGSMGYAMLR